MARAPEKDTLRMECPSINKTLAHSTDLVTFGDFLSSHNFLSKTAVNSILDVTGESKTAKASRLMMAVDTNITTTGSQTKTTSRFNEFLLLLYNDLELKELAIQLADRNKALSAERNIPYSSPLPPPPGSTAATGTDSATQIQLAPPHLYEQSESTSSDGLMTLEELLRELGMEKEQLKERVTESGLDFIAKNISHEDWGTYARKLGVPESTMDDIKEDNTKAKEQRFKGLKEWKKTQAFRAKYLVLVELFLKENNAELAEKVCEYVKK